ncbi:MAG TPA: DUF2071 domain-containing protein [Verrucomicrobiae bacterium]|jgi:uncharacterized protein YqjF (DUF2071 family)|nr:DUF2071 domain-containing protein [Verrucomicrobiae bacterium]
MSRTKAPPQSAQEDFQTQWVGADSILFATAHRPWPLPTAPWIMTQRWNDLLFLHYSLDPEIVRVKVPEVLTLDTYRQRAWITVAPFWINHMRPPGVPSLPWFSSFNEINVRTYVTVGNKPGVYFFSLDASNLSAVWGARMFYRLPYWQAAMEVKGKGKAKIEYNSKRQHGPKPAELKCSYGPTSPLIFHARPGTLDHFLTERYCLYTATRKRLYRGEIHHLPWDLQTVDLELQENTMTQSQGLQLPTQPDLAYFARELKVLFWAPERLL